MTLGLSVLSWLNRWIWGPLGALVFDTHMIGADLLPTATKAPRMVTASNVSGSRVMPAPRFWELGVALLNAGVVLLFCGGFFVSLVEERELGVLAAWLLPGVVFGATGVAFAAGRFERLRRKAMGHAGGSDVALFSAANFTSPSEHAEQERAHHGIRHGFLVIAEESCSVWAFSDTAPRRVIAGGEVSAVERIHVWGRLLFDPQLRVYLADGGELVVAPVHPGWRGLLGYRSRDVDHLARKIENLTPQRG